MTIEISGVLGKSVQDSVDSSKVNSTGPNGGGHKAAATPSSGGGDKVSLTSSAMQLQALEERIADLPVVDVQKVSDVQRALATGTLDVNEENAANNLLQIEKSYSS